METSLPIPIISPFRVLGPFPFHFFRLEGKGRNLFHVHFPSFLLLFQELVLFQKRKEGKQGRDEGKRRERERERTKKGERTNWIIFVTEGRTKRPLLLFSNLSLLNSRFPASSLPKSFFFTSQRFFKSDSNGSNDGSGKKKDDEREKETSRSLRRQQDAVPRWQNRFKVSFFFSFDPWTELHFSSLLFGCMSCLDPLFLAWSDSEEEGGGKKGKEWQEGNEKSGSDTGHFFLLLRKSWEWELKVRAVRKSWKHEKKRKKEKRMGKKEKRGEEDGYNVRRIQREHF